MLLGFLELQQKWGHVEEGEACWSLWRYPRTPAVSLALPSPSPALTENKSSLTWAAVVQPTCLRQGSCVGGWV